MNIYFYTDKSEPFTPIKIADALIEEKALEVDALKEIAEHLLVYCKHREGENE